MSNADLASPEQIAQLGAGVLAVRVAGGKVPDGVAAISVSGELFQIFQFGQKDVQAPKHGKLWWVQLGGQSVRFAPDPATPEAGIEIVIELDITSHFRNIELIGKLLNWLDGQGSVVAANAVVKLLAGQPCLQLPPCVQRDELNQIARSVSGVLMREVGLRCIQLDRIDLYPEVNCAAMPSEAAPQDHATTDQPAKNAAPSVATPTQVTSSPTLGKVLADDAKFEHRLFIEIPQLANRLRDRPWPDDSAAMAQQRAVLQRVEHMVATSGRLPSLASRIDPHVLSANAVRLLSAESRKAAQGLDDLWIALDGAPPEAPVSASELDQIQCTVGAIEQAIARRRTPWWEAA